MLKLSIAPSDLDKVIERSIETVRALAEQSNIKIAFEISHLSVMADADRLSQVVVNLLSNAVKFSPPGARIVIEAKKQAEFAEVSVTDEGPGIPGDALTKVFDRFQQADPDDSRARSGTGLGLAISKAIVEGHGGAMGVNSEVGKGSRFWFRIRLGDGDA
ncbi:MAG TPA: HAMP domain-containing sensor histidine kinase, partial [Candidatus Obscuribacterales bacterium]